MAASIIASVAKRHALPLSPLKRYSCFLPWQRTVFQMNPQTAKPLGQDTLVERNLRRVIIWDQSPRKR
jgi:hypothetical protein